VITIGRLVSFICFMNEAAPALKSDKG